MAEGFQIKDSGERATFSSGMIRDTEIGKTDFTTIFDGPMADRYAAHLSKAKAKYPDLPDGTPNWMQANGPAELIRFRKSAFRHFRQWLRGDRDEDHAAAVYFNVNGFEYVRDRMAMAPPAPPVGETIFKLAAAEPEPTVKEPEKVDTMEDLRDAFFKCRDATDQGRAKAILMNVGGSRYVTSVQSCNLAATIQALNEATEAGA